MNTDNGGHKTTSNFNSRGRLFFSRFFPLFFVLDSRLLYVPAVPAANEPAANVPAANVQDANVPDANAPVANVQDANVPDAFMGGGGVPNGHFPR